MTTPTLARRTTPRLSNPPLPAPPRSTSDRPAQRQPSPNLTSPDKPSQPSTTHPAPTNDRNYAAEMRAVIDAMTSDRPYIAATVAEQVVEMLRVTDPDLLDGWLHTGAVQFVRMAITDRDRSARTHARAVSGRSVFRDAAIAYEAGETEALSGWLTTVFVVEDGTRVRLGDMRKPDLIWSANEYDRRAQDHLMQSAFLAALAKKVGRGRVSDHYTDERLTELWRSISER